MFFIVLCCYQPNLEHLRAQLDSISQQTDSDFFCLVQDDASPPEWSAEIAAACAADPRFLFRRTETRRGIFHNFEHGLSLTPQAAQYICYCDPDGLWAKDKLQRQRAALQDPDVTLCHTDLELIDAQAQPLHPSCFAFEQRNVEDFSLPQLILRNSISGCTLAFRASLLPQLLPFPDQGVTPRFHHDHFTALVAAMYGRIVTINEPLVRYRQHDSSVLRTDSATPVRYVELAPLPPLMKGPRAHLTALEEDWTWRRVWIDILLARAPQRPDPAAQLDVLRRWTQSKAGAAHLFKYALPHLFRRADYLSPVMFPVLLGRLYHSAHYAETRLQSFRQAIPEPQSYLRQLPQQLGNVMVRALPESSRDQLVRLTHSAVHLLPPRLRRLGNQLWCDYAEHKPLTQSLAGKKVCLFAHFDRDGVIEEYVVYHLKCLAAAGVVNLFISTAATLDTSEVEKIGPYCAAIVRRDNVGLDFGSWRTALLLYPEIMSCQLLLLANDSVYGPMHDLSAVLDKMAATGSDFWGITESLQRRSHYQSYFLGFSRAGLNKAPLQKFLRRIRLLGNKDEIIQRYEVGMKRQLSRAGLRGAALIPAQPGQLATENPTLHRWQQGLAAGSPYLKVQLLRENPHHQPIDRWPDVVRSYGYDPSLITRHLRRFAAT